MFEKTGDSLSSSDTSDFKKEKKKEEKRPKLIDLELMRTLEAKGFKPKNPIRAPLDQKIKIITPQKRTKRKKPKLDLKPLNSNLQAFPQSSNQALIASPQTEQNMMPIASVNEKNRSAEELSNFLQKKDVGISVPLKEPTLLSSDAQIDKKIEDNKEKDLIQGHVTQIPPIPKTLPIKQQTKNNDISLPTLPDLSVNTLIENKSTVNYPQDNMLKAFPNIPESQRREHRKHLILPHIPETIKIPAHLPKKLDEPVVPQLTRPEKIKEPPLKVQEPVLEVKEPTVQKIKVEEQSTKEERLTDENGSSSDSEPPLPAVISVVPLRKEEPKEEGFFSKLFGLSTPGDELEPITIVTSKEGPTFEPTPSEGAYKEQKQNTPAQAPLIKKKQPQTEEDDSMSIYYSKPKKL